MARQALHSRPWGRAHRNSGRGDRSRSIGLGVVRGRLRHLQQVLSGTPPPAALPLPASDAPPVTVNCMED
eukprot:15033155-Alexandrium_andersonii.AAC.1